MNECILFQASAHRNVKTLHTQTDMQTIKMQLVLLKYS